MSGKISDLWSFDVEHRGEMSAGIRPFSDYVTISVKSGDPGGEKGEFGEFMRQALEEWFDGAGVVHVEAKLCNTLEEYREELGKHYGFVTKEQLEDILKKWHTSVRLHPCLVRCGCGRFTCPMQDVEHWIGIIEKEGSDYVRDVSIQQIGTLGQHNYGG